MTDIKRVVPFSPPDISEAEIQEVAEALRSGWITTGPRTKQLEKNIAEWIGTEKCVCLNSQTACAEMALCVMGIGRDDEVIVPAYTYTASASVIAHVGAKIVMIDTQRDSFEMDYDALEAAITERTKAVIPVDLAGVPCDYDRILKSWRARSICSSLKMIFRRRSEESLLWQIPHMPSALNGTAKCLDLLLIFQASAFTL
jgi:dTDP-4-amino-4,6-dideoxygalactose transaminase